MRYSQYTSLQTLSSLNDVYSVGESYVRMRAKNPENKLLKLMSRLLCIHLVYYKVALKTFFFGKTLYLYAFSLTQIYLPRPETFISLHLSALCFW